MDQKIPKLSRQTALAGGYPTYFTGEPCAIGHVAKRYTVSAACAECIRDAKAAEAARYKAAKIARESA